MFNVLIAGPQGETLSRIQSFLTVRGHTVIDIANDGMEAYAKIQIRKPDLVILDVNLSRMDNISLTRWIKIWSPAIHVVFVTHVEVETYRHLASLLSVDGYVCVSTLEKDLIHILNSLKTNQASSNSGVLH